LEDLHAWVRETIGRLEYEATPARGGLQIPNCRQKLRTWFRYDGVEVFPQLRKGGAEWVWKWRTLALGDLRRPGPVG